MSKSEKKTDIWGDEYIQHYDDQGNKAGTTRVETDMWGDRYEQHRDSDGNMTGHTTHETDMWGDRYEQHRDSDGNKTGYSTHETDMWGDRYEQHRDSDGNMTGHTTHETDMWGDRYKHHRDQQNGRLVSSPAVDRTSNGLSSRGSVQSSSRGGVFIWLLAIIAIVLIAGFASRSPDAYVSPTQPTYQTAPVSMDSANSQNQALTEAPRSFSPSFDCALAREGSEAQICGSEILSQYDRQLDELYHRAHRESTFEERSLLTSKQREWLVERENCMERRAQTACLIVLYQGRLGDLRHLLDAERVARILTPSRESSEIADQPEIITARPSTKATGLGIRVSTPDGKALNRIEEAIRREPGVKDIAIKSIALGGDSIFIVFYDKDPQILVDSLKVMGVHSTVYLDVSL
jgi:uncharacterized protein